MANKKASPDFRKVKLDGCARVIEQGSVFAMQGIVYAVTHILGFFQDPEVQKLLGFSKRRPARGKKRSRR